MNLPTVRRSFTTRQEICGYKCYITVSFIEDDKARTVAPIEVFVKIAKQGTVVSGLMDTITTLISISLQEGVLWSRIRSKLEYHKFEDRGDELHSSLVDGVARSIDDMVVARAKEVDYVPVGVNQRSISSDDASPGLKGTAGSSFTI